MATDDKGNLIKVCLFESFLAKYFLENFTIFRPLLRKLFSAIEALILANAETPMFDRTLFSVMSCLKTQDDSVTDFGSLRHSNSIVTIDTFFKYLTEQVMHLPGVKTPGLPASTVNLVKSLRPIDPMAFFTEQVHYEQAILSTMRPKVLFLKKNRGVIELRDSEELPTTRMGILSERDAPIDLVNYLQFKNYPSRQVYQPDENSMMTLWLRAHYLPVISGVSGGIGKTISKLATFVDLSIDEYLLLGLLTTSSTVALGHHSFFEVMKPLSFIVGQLKEQDTLLAFYEQIIPDEIKRLKSYREHISGPYGAFLIEAFMFDHNKQAVAAVTRKA